jgi:hypothetical protein
MSLEEGMLGERSERSSTLLQREALAGICSSIYANHWQHFDFPSFPMITFLNVSAQQGGELFR